MNRFLKLAVSGLGSLATAGILISYAPAAYPGPLLQDGSDHKHDHAKDHKHDQASEKKEVVTPKPYSPPKLETGVDLSKVKSKKKKKEVQKPEDRLNARAKAALLGDTEKREGPVGRVAFDEGAERFDFGELVEGVEAQHTFRLRNDGEGDLIIKRIKPSCGCTLADTTIATAGREPVVYETGKPIPPGSTIEVHATLKTKGKRGNASSSIALYTDDPDNAVFRLHLTSQVQSVLEVEPAQLNFGHSTPTEKLDEKLEFKCPAGTPFVLSLADDNNIPDEMSVTLTPVEPTPEGKSDRWEARVELGPGLLEGVRNYPLHFVSDMPIAGAEPGADGKVPTYDIRSYAMAQVLGVVYAKPTFLNFSLVRPGAVVSRVFKVTTRELDYEFPEDLSVEIKGFRGDFAYPDSVETTVRMAEDRKSFEIDLRIVDLPEDLDGSFGGFVEVGVNHPTKEKLQVRFSGVCRATVGQPTPLGGAQK